MNAALLDIPLKTMSGEVQSLAYYTGKVLLVVNVASKCGLTPQYEGLEKLYRRFKDRGLLVLGLPANDFLQQEPGTDAQIGEFCRTNYNVSFPLFSKIAVTGKEQHALYHELIKAKPISQGDPEAFRKHLVGHGITTNPAPGVLWNFEKFLIARDGHVAARFAPPVTPEDPAVIEAIEAELAKS